jgi:hypothetical protein
MCAESRNSGWNTYMPVPGAPVYSVNYATPEPEVEKLRTQLAIAEAEIRELKAAVKALQAASLYGRKLKTNR